MLVDHALARFSTDNLTVMVVRFDPQKLMANTEKGIGVEGEGKDRGAISEVEMIVGEARRHSNIPPDAEITEAENNDISEQVIREQEEEQEPGPELTPGGKEEADSIVSHQSLASSSGGNADKR